MEVRSRPELGLKNTDPFREMTTKRMENPAKLPGTPDVERQIVENQRTASAVTVNQSKPSFKIQGQQVDLLA